MNSIQKPKSSSKGQLVSLQFKGESVRQDRDGRFSLNDLHRMSGAGKGKEPKEWAKLDTTKSLVEVLQDQQDLNGGKSPIQKVFVSTRGGGGGTWAALPLALAYASYLSPEFRAACLKVVEERIEEEQNPELGIARAQERAVKAWTRTGKTSSWIGVRIEGISTRNEFTAICAKRGAKDFRALTNAIYLGIYNDNAKALREKHELKTGANIRDAMGETALIMVRLAENLAGKKAEGENLYGDTELSKAAHHCARSVHEAVRGALKGSA